MIAWIGGVAAVTAVVVAALLWGAGVLALILGAAMVALPLWYFCACAMYGDGVTRDEAMGCAATALGGVVVLVFGGLSVLGGF